MLDRLRSTFMGLQMGNDPGDFFVFRPRFGSIAFYSWQKLDSPPANIWTKGCVMSRPETC